MMKTCLFTILVLLLRPVLAASMMSHEKFVHLTYEEQKKMVVSTMELIVEIEEKYEHQVKTSGFDPERFRRYTDLIRKVSSVIFPEAHARNERIGQYINQLRTIVTDSNKCIYGGWPSSMSGNLCVHPSRGSFRATYLAERGCSGIGQISCNPAIFGFKNVDQKTLFCVPAGRAVSSADASSDNSSRECMRLALLDPPASGASTKDERIRNLVAGIAANPNDSDAVFDFLLKACACDARTPAISEHYQNYMRPHRTCFSMLRMMAEVMPQCSGSGAPMDANQLSFLDHIKSSVSEAEIRSSTPNTIDAAYRLVVNGNAAGQGFVSRSDYQAICETCEDNLKLASGVCCVAPLGPNTAKTECVASSDEGGAVVVDRDAPSPPDVGGSPSPTPGGDTPQNSCANGANNHPTCTCDTETQDSFENRCVPKCTTGTRDATTGSCPDAPATCTNGATDHPECRQCEGTKEMVNGSCQDKCAVGVRERDPGTFACSVVCTDSNKDLVIEKKSCEQKCTNGERNADGDCPSPHTLEVKSTIKDLNTTTITVKIDGGSDIIPGFTVIWFKRGTTTTVPTFTGTNTTVTTPETPTALTDDPDPESSSESDTEEEPATQNTTWDDPKSNETPIEKSADDTEFTAPRLTENYQVCARLVDLSDHSIEKESCATVQKKTPSAAQGFNPGMQPMGPTRGGSSDAIFRGAR